MLKEEGSARSQTKGGVGMNGSTGARSKSWLTRFIQNLWLR